MPEALVAELHKYREVLANKSVTEAVPSLHPALDRIEERQTRAFTLYGGNEEQRAQFVTVATEQIEDYACLIQTVVKKPKVEDPMGLGCSDLWN